MQDGFCLWRNLRFSAVAFEFIFPLTETSQLIVDLGFAFEAQTNISSITIICIVRGKVVLGINFPVQNPACYCLYYKFQLPEQTSPSVLMQLQAEIATVNFFIVSPFLNYY